MNDHARAEVFLLAQNRLLREALARILSKKTDIEGVGSCALSSDSLKEIVSAAPNVLVMDSFTTNLAHVAFVREVQQSVIGIKLVMIGMEADAQHFLQDIPPVVLVYDV